MERVRRIGLGIALGAAGLAVLPLVLPFVLAWGAAAVVEPGVAALGRRTRLPRWARSGLCMTGLLVLVGAVLYFFFRILCAEVSLLAGELPELLSGLQAPAEQLKLWLEGLVRRVGDGLAGPLQRWIEDFFAGSGALLRSLAGWLTGVVSGAVSGLPELLFGIVTALIAAYMTSASLPELKAWLRRKLPSAWQDRLRLWRDSLRRALGGWLKAQAKVFGLVFLVLTVGLWLLGVEFFLLFGGLIALLDALPVLGSGTVLLPWALFSFLQGQQSRGFGLLALYAVAALTRAVFEPRLVGRQFGLPPLVTLIAVYTGFRLLGVGGMILFPIIALVGKQFVSYDLTS